MVAAWIWAETGVGPAMASGSQTISGTWADLPMAAPGSSSRPMAVIIHGGIELPIPLICGDGFGAAQLEQPDDGNAEGRHRRSG